MKMLLTSAEFAAQHGVTRQWISQLLHAGRIPGARLLGTSVAQGVWLIPQNAKILKLKRTKRSK